MFALFPLGRIVATPGALAALERAKQPPTCTLARHAIGDWGELEPSDVAENEYSVARGFRLLSSYQTDAGEKAMDHHRGGPVGDHAASARRVLTSCRIGPLAGEGCRRAVRHGLPVRRPDRHPHFLRVRLSSRSIPRYVPYRGGNSRPTGALEQREPVLGTEP